MAESRKPPELDGALILDGDMDGDLDDEIEPRPRSASSSESDVDPSEDGKADLANEMLVEILKRMGLAVQVSVREDAEEVVLDVAGEDAGRVIGKKGQTLDALQFLINKIVNRFPEGRRHIVDPAYDLCHADHVPEPGDVRATGAHPRSHLQRAGRGGARDGTGEGSVAGHGRHR